MRVRIRLAVACALLLAPVTAHAHADVTAVGTAPSGDVRVELSAPVEHAFLTVSAPGATARIDPADPQAVLVRGLRPGERVTVRGMSRDGHAFRGAATGRDGAMSIAADAAVFIGLLGLLGLVCLRFAVVGPAWRSGGPRPPGAGDPAGWRAATEGALRSGARGWWRALAVLLAIGAIGLALAPAGLLRDLGAGGGDLGTLVADTRWGRSWLVQVVALALVALVALILRRRAAADAPDPPRGWGYCLVVPLVAAAWAISFTSHASSGTDAGLGIGIDAVHIVATAAWLGGLAGLIAMVPRAVRELGPPDGTRLAAAAVVRFSGLAIASVGVLVVTGVYRAIGELSAFGDLVDTDYGVALLVKLIVLAVLLCGGAYNRLVLHPKLERAVLGLRDDDGGAVARLRISVAAELVLATALLITVAILVSLPPP